MKATSSNDIYFYNVLTGISSWTKPIQSPQKDIKHPTTIPCKREKLALLLTKHSSNQAKDNKKILEKIRGQEYIPIEVIESFLAALNSSVHVYY
mmetsp:Transcript_9824/g.12440  ORF Transcript_9824/g.12440 Transcript_9824/m.12440 type:complete len:94 (+) Transcript_9824:924-1205(+)